MQHFQNSLLTRFRASPRLQKQPQQQQKQQTTRVLTIEILTIQPGTRLRNTFLLRFREKKLCLERTIRNAETSRAKS